MLNWSKKADTDLELCKCRFKFICISVLCSIHPTSTYSNYMIGWPSQKLKNRAQKCFCFGAQPQFCRVRESNLLFSCCLLLFYKGATADIISVYKTAVVIYLKPFLFLRDVKKIGLYYKLYKSLFAFFFHYLVSHHRRLLCFT